MWWCGDVRDAVVKNEMLWWRGKCCGDEYDGVVVMSWCSMWGWGGECGFVVMLRDYLSIYYSFTHSFIILHSERTIQCVNHYGVESGGNTTRQDNPLIHKQFMSLKPIRQELCCSQINGSWVLRIAVGLVLLSWRATLDGAYICILNGLLSPCSVHISRQTDRQMKLTDTDTVPMHQNIMHLTPGTQL